MCSTLISIGFGDYLYNVDVRLGTYCNNRSSTIGVRTKSDTVKPTAHLTFLAFRKPALTVFMALGKSEPLVSNKTLQWSQQMQLTQTERSTFAVCT